MISLKNVSMTFGPKVLFNDVTLNLPERNRYGIVGANGTGKSTLMKIIAGMDEPAAGEVTIAGQQSIGFLKQDQFAHEETRIVDVVIQGKKALWDAMQERDAIYMKPDFSDEDGYRIAEIEEVVMHNDGYEAEAQAQKLLSGLAIPESKHFEPMKILSGGFKLRVLLAQALFNNPDILLLDEPTNHLDILTIGWLEEYLRTQYQGTLYFISHDRSFINNLATSVMDIDYGDIRLYKGNYDKFEDAKKLFAEQRKTERVGLESRIADMQKFVDRFKAKASKAKQAKSREKMIERIELPDIENSSRRYPFYDFKIVRPSSRMVVDAVDLEHGFGDHTLFKNVKFKIQRGEKILLIGPNGVGKSTLIKILMGVHEPRQGSVKWGEECHRAYFSQDHYDQLDYSEKVLNWLQQQLSEETEQDCRRYLGRMLFRSDDVNKPISTISGGESARLLFARMSGQKHNIMVMDEPTNHLDLEAIEALTQALIAYQGTLILVSHDRAFSSKIATRVIAMTGNKVTDFDGTYDEYIQKVGDDYLCKEWLKAQG
jgi:ATPase subunit of ABC transporter with duplicated ATPase domains